MTRWPESSRARSGVRPRIALFALGAITAGVLLPRLPDPNPVGKYWPWPVLFGVVVLAVLFIEWWPTRSTTAIRSATRATGLAAIGAGVLLRYLPDGVPGHGWWPALIAVGVALEGWLVYSWQRRRTGSAGMVHRWARKSRRNDGLASPWAIFRVASGFAMRRKATVLRPSLRDLPWWRRWTVPTVELGTAVARVGWQTVWSPVEDITLRVGGPRSGKSGEIAGRILEARGAVIATTTRTDLIDLTAPLRAEFGPVWVFNPTGIGDLESTIVFDPLSGCEQPATAKTRAEDLLAGTATGAGAGTDREFWTVQAAWVLAALMHAAAIGGADMRTVLAWVANPDEAKAEVIRFLRRSTEPAFEAEAEQFLTTNDRTRTSITSSIMPALSWLTDETAARAAGAAPDQVRTPDGVAGFDVAALLQERGTVFLLGAEESHTGPLLTALTGHIAREARRIATRKPSGRLDPPLTLALDEAALICPVPLDKWTADMGGRNITIHIAVQSRAQLHARWGDDGARTILNNSATLLVFGGIFDDEDLQAYSLLTGHRDEQVPTHDAEGQVTALGYRQVPVLSPAQIAQIPAGRVLIFRRGLAPAIGRVQMAWKRPDVRAFHRAVKQARRRDQLTHLTDRVLAKLPGAVPTSPVVDRQADTGGAR